MLKLYKSQVISWDFLFLYSSIFYKMKNTKYTFTLVFTWLVSIHLFGQTNKDYSFNANNLLEHVKELSSDAYQGRRTGTAGAEMAKAYIIAQLEAHKIKPLGKKLEQAFEFKTRNKTYKGVNVLGKIQGTDYPEKHIVLSAHYDHEGIKNGQIYNGADDDASGVSALFAFAEFFQKNPPKHTVILAFFDAEELGLQGSKFYIENPIVALNSIVLNINMDMISRNTNNELFVTGIKTHPQLETTYKNFNTSKNITIIAGHDGTDGKQNWMYASDHAPFYQKGIPFLYFGVEDHKDYHKPTDDFENIHPEFYKDAVACIIKIFQKIDTFSL